MARIALSYSRISDYRQCPHKFRLKYIDKVPNFQLKDEDKSPALVRGGNIHKDLERYVTMKREGVVYEPTLPEVIGATPLIDMLYANYNLYPERQIAIDENFKEVSWYDKNAYFRVIYDLVGFGNDLFLGDYKTGKMTDYSGSMSELGQLHMSAVVGMSLWSEYSECSTVYIYVDHKKTIPVKFKQESLDPMKEKLQIEHDIINCDVNFMEKRNQYCKWCEATKDQCIHSKKDKS